MRGIDDAAARDGALPEIAERLPAAAALAVARGIDNARTRARALANVAQRLSAEQRPAASERR